MAENEAKNYIDELAEDIGERCDVKNERLLRMYALLGLVKGTGVTAENVHDATRAWTASANLNDPSIAPFSGHSNGQLDRDRDAIIAAVEAKLHREARAEMDKPKSSSRSPEQARPGD